MANDVDGGGGYQGRGGAGGKLRTSRLTRRSSTPYDRPQTGRHAPAPVRAAAAESRRSNTNNNDNNGSSWLSRIVDPASRIITNGAMRWFSSVFRKRLPETHSSDGDEEAGSDADLEVQEDSLQEDTEDGIKNVMVTEMTDQQCYATPNENQRNEPEVSGFEELLKDKTISREEFNRLTKVLQTRVVDSPSGLEGYEGKMREERNGGKEPVNFANVEAQRWREERKKAREEKDNCLWDDTLFYNALSPSASQNVCDNAGSTPADIAKAFMGVRSHRTPSSTLALQHRPFRDERTPNRLFRDERTPNRQNVYQLVPRKTEGWVFGNGQIEDRMKTPYDRFKSPQSARKKLSGINCTPYSRNPNQRPGAEYISEGSQISTPASRWTPIQSPLTSGRQMLKRRSSVLDDGFTSVGPIRRTRQKSTFCTPFRKSDPSCSNSNQPSSVLFRGYDPGQNALAAAFRKPMENEKQNDFSSAVQAQEEPNDLSASLAYVPQQSSETARKILEHLDRMVPSPKEKSAEAQLAIARAKSPTPLSIGMLNRQARRSTETIDANHFLNMHASRSSSFLENNQSGAQGPSDSEKKHEGKGKAPLFNSVQTCGEAPTSHTGDVVYQSHEIRSSKADNKLQVLDDAVIVPEKNKGFRMSALEESDDEGHVSRNATMVVPSQAGKITFTSHGNIDDGNFLKGDKAVTSTSTIMTTKAANALTGATSVIVESSTSNSLGFSFPVGPNTGNFPEPPTPTPMPSPMNKGGTQPAINSITPIFNFGSASASKGPVFSFSSSGCTDVDTTKPEFNFKFESKPESSFSSTAVAAAAAVTTSTSPFQTTLGPLESPALTFKGASALGISGNLPSVPSSNTMSTVTTVATPACGIPLFGEPASKNDDTNSVSFSSSGMSSFTVTQANNPSNLSASSSSSQGEDNLVTGSTAGDQNLVKSGNEVKASIFSNSPSLFALANAPSSTPLNTCGQLISTSSLLPNTHSAFAGSFLGQVSSSAPATTSASLVFGSSAFSASLSSSAPSASLFSSSLAASFGGTNSSLFGSALAGTASSASTSLFGASAPSSFSSASFPSFGISNSIFSTGTSAPFPSGSSPASGSATTTTLGASSSPLLGSTGTSFGGSGASGFGFGTTTQFGCNTSPSFGLGTTTQFGSNTSSVMGLSTSSQMGFTTSLSSSQFGSNTSPSFGSGVTFGANATMPSSASGPSFSFGSGGTSSFSSSNTFGSGSSLSFGGSSPLFGSASTPAFGGSSASASSSTTALGGSSTSFASSISPALGGSSASYGSASTSAFGGSVASFGSGGSSSFFGSSSTPASGGSSSLFGSTSTLASGGGNSLFGSTSTPTSGGSSSLFGSASTPLFGSSSTPPFGMTQTFGSSSSTSSQSTAPSFGSGFGGTPAVASTGFSFGGSAATSSASFALESSGNTSSGTTFSFNPVGGASSGTFTFGFKDTSTPPQQPVFGITNASPNFGPTSSSTPTDQMEDSMAEDPAQVSDPPVFGGQPASSGPAFMFSSQPSTSLPGQSVFQFGAQPNSAGSNPFAAGAPTAFNPSGSGLEFSGGSFSLGAGGEKSGRKYIKPKRDKGRRK